MTDKEFEKQYKDSKKQFSKSSLIIECWYLKKSRDDAMKKWQEIESQLRQKEVDYINLKTDFNKYKGLSKALSIALAEYFK